MLQKEVIEAGEKIASDLMDAQVSKNMGNMGGHIIKDISKYDNSDLIQKYIDDEIVSVEAIYTAMKRVEKNGSSHNKQNTPCSRCGKLNDAHAFYCQWCGFPDGCAMHIGSSASWKPQTAGNSEAGANNTQQLMATLFNEIFGIIRGRCISDESASVAAAEVTELMVNKNTSHNKPSAQ